MLVANYDVLTNLPPAYCGHRCRACRISHDPIVDRANTLESIVAWARDEDNVRAVVLTGSVALNSDVADALADLDIELYVGDPRALLNASAWYEQFGEVLVVEALPNPDWHPTRLVYYAGGKIDFMVAPVEALSGTTYERAFRVLLDKDDLTNQLIAVRPKSNRPPDGPEFLTCINWFYAGALMSAKCIARREPWLAKYRDWDVKSNLLQMLEWDHKSRYGWAYETWYQGKHMTKWMDTELRDRLEACWANFSLADSADALLASIELFDEITARSADALGLPAFDSARIRNEVSAILGKRTM
jgi:aminoglycoside 6-adenylyltransferase